MSKRRLEYGECKWCAGTGTIKRGWLGKRLHGDDEYDCPICGGDGKHIGDFQYSRPLIWVSDD